MIKKIILSILLVFFAKSYAMLVPTAPNLPLKSYVIMDADTEFVIAEHNADLRMHPASLTKMMTSYIGEREIAMKKISRRDEVTVSKKAWMMKGSTMFLDVGDKIKVQDLLKGIIVVSGNDASVALAEHIAGSEYTFSEMMNATARNLGMLNSHFMNASGWPSNKHYSSAKDMAILAKHIVYDFPDYYDLYKMKYFQYGVDKKTGKPLNRQVNRNRLLWTDSNVDGLKTGHIDETGYHVAITSKNDNRRLIVVVMGALNETQRLASAQQLLTYGFRFYDNALIDKAHQTISTIKVWKGALNKVNLVLNQDLLVTHIRGIKNFKKQIDISPYIEAPIRKGQILGSLKVMLDNDQVKTVDLIAEQDVELGSWYKKIFDSIILMFKKKFNID